MAAFNKKVEFDHVIDDRRSDNIVSYNSEIVLTVSRRAGLLGEDLVPSIGKLRKVVLPKGDHCPSRQPRVSLERELLR